MKRDEAFAAMRAKTPVTIHAFGRRRTGTIIQVMERRCRVWFWTGRRWSERPVHLEYVRLRTAGDPPLRSHERSGGPVS